MEFRERPLAITDVETTGTDPRIHEIVEMGLVLVNQTTLEVLDRWSSKVKPEHTETAEAKALEVNGYNEGEWREAIDLRSAMHIYSQRTKDAIFAAHHVTFDWGFVDEAFRKAEVPNLMDYHRIDLLTIAWLKGRQMPTLTKFNLKYLCQFLGIPEEPKPHRALTGVLTEYEVLKRLLATTG